MKIDAIVEEVKESGEVYVPDKILDFIKIKDYEAERILEEQKWIIAITFECKAIVNEIIE